MIALTLHKTITVTSIGFYAAKTFVALQPTQMRQKPNLPFRILQSQDLADDIQPIGNIKALKTNRQTTITAADFAGFTIQSP